jgi:hypothetical protein
MLSLNLIRQKTQVLKLVLTTETQSKHHLEMKNYLRTLVLMCGRYNTSFMAIYIRGWYYRCRYCN